MVNVNSIGRRFIIFLIYYTLFIQGLMSLLGLPQVVLYFKDIIMIMIFCLCVFAYLQNKKAYRLKKMYVLWIILLTYCLFNGLLMGVSIFSILISVRKMFRGFLFMFFCAKFLQLNDVSSVMHNCYKIQFLNVALILIQRIILNLGQDYCNGIFGTGLTNNYMSLFCILVVGYCTVEYLGQKCSARTFYVQLGIVVVIMAVAELKVLFFMLPIVLIIIFRENFLIKLRGIKTLIVGVIVLGIGLLIFRFMYRNQLNVLTSISGLMNYNQWGLATSSIVNRINWIPYTWENIFGNSLQLRLFGIGFGSISGTLFGFESSSYLNALGYGSYCLSTVFLEIGLVGLLFLCSWFIYYLFKSTKRYPNGYRKIHKRFSQAFVLTLIVFLDYSNFLFNDSSFLAFFGLSIILIVNKSNETLFEDKLLVQKLE